MVQDDAPSPREALTRVPVLTIGHSSLTWGEFANLLVGYGVQRLADVRSYPHSRRFPHFNRELLRSGLLEFGIHYEHFPELGGKRETGLDPSPNTAWPAGGFRNYADHMLSLEFGLAIHRLLAGAGRKTVILCAESAPGLCHRNLLSDYLALVERTPVVHILTLDRTEAHRPHPRARLEQGRLIYPPLQGELF